MLKDGIVDVFVGGGAPQVTSLQEIEVTKPIKVIPIDEEKLKGIGEKGLGISYDSLPGGTYKGLEEEIPTYTLV
ncbi:TAXI family TRAP transporter solute-binding subunit, partial [Planococcus sp. SIMBA_143]